MKTKVIFKKVVYAPNEADEQAPTEIVAIFVDERENNNCLSCYAHLGQHSTIHESYLNDSKDATYEEYIDLYNELVNSVGYKLSVFNSSFAENKSQRIIDKHEKFKDIMIKYQNEEYGDFIIDEICALFNFPDTIAAEKRAKKERRKLKNK